MADTSNAVGHSTQIGLLLIDAREFARLLGVSQRTLWRLLAARQLIPPLKLGGSTRWRISDVQAWIEGGCEPVG
jgi:excisionase family DNA binding protein